MFLPNDPCCSYFAPQLLLDVTDCKKATTKERVCSVFGEYRDKNSCATCIYRTNYTQNHNRVLIFVGRPGRKNKRVPQLHQTEKTNRNLGSENTTSLPECLALCVMETWLCGSVYRRLSNARCGGVTVGRGVQTLTENRRSSKILPNSTRL